MDPDVEAFIAQFGRPPSSEIELQAFRAQGFPQGSAPAPPPAPFGAPAGAAQQPFLAGQGQPTVATAQPAQAQLQPAVQPGIGAPAPAATPAPIPGQVPGRFDRPSTAENVARSRLSGTGSEPVPQPGGGDDRGGSGAQETGQLLGGVLNLVGALRSDAEDFGAIPLGGATEGDSFTNIFSRQKEVRKAKKQAEEERKAAIIGAIGGILSGGSAGGGGGGERRALISRRKKKGGLFS